MMLSVVTICFNAGEEITTTIESLKNQEMCNNMLVEHIIIDNMSEDNSQSIIDKYKKDYESKQFRILYIREKDQGIYDAMNKGVKASSGEWVIMMNAGDTFYNSQTLKTAWSFLLKENADVLVGSYDRVDPAGERIIMPPSVELIKKRMIYCHQAVFFRTSVHKNFLYNLRYHIVADYDVLLRLYLGGYVVRYIPICIATYDATGLSANRMVETHREMQIVRRNNGVIEKGLYDKMIYIYGLVKRIVLAIIPTKLRWNLVRIKNTLFEKRYL